MSSPGKRSARRRTATPATPRDTEHHRCSTGADERHADDRSCSVGTTLIRGSPLRRRALLRSACIRGVTGRYRRRGRRAFLSTRHARPGDGGETQCDRGSHGEDPPASHVERHLPCSTTHCKRTGFGTANSRGRSGLRSGSERGTVGRTPHRLTSTSRPRSSGRPAVLDRLHCGRRASHPGAGRRHLYGTARRRRGPRRPGALASPWLRPPGRPADPGQRRRARGPR